MIKTLWHRDKKYGLWSQALWICISALPLSSCVSLGNPKLPSPYLKSGGNNRT